MRSLVWCGVAFVALACGRIHRPLHETGSGGGAGTAGKGGGGVAGSSAGNSAAGLSATGGAGASGGAPGSGAMAGSGTSSGGLGAGGSGGSGGSAGNASGGVGAATTAGTGGAMGGSGGLSCDDLSEGGAAGASDLECGEYIGCGCGCCRPQQFLLQSTCYYPERGDRLADIKCADQLEGLQAMCKNAPCSSGYRHICCTTPEETAGSFVAYGYGDTISIMRTFADRQTRAFVSEGTLQPRWPISAPAGWYFESTDELSGPPDADERYQIGGLGSLEFGRECTITFDFTLFFATERGPVQPMRFKGDSVPVESGDGSCATDP